MEISTSLDELAVALPTATTITFDWETSGANAHTVEPVGIGIYIPSQQAVFYINVGHAFSHADIPKYSVAAVVPILNQFFMRTDVRAIGHNLLYDLIINQKLGVAHACQFEDSMILAHRRYEFYRVDKESDSITSWRHIRVVGYGLKNLIRVFFNEEPLTLKAIGNPKTGDPEKVAAYCVADVINTWRLRERLMVDMHEYQHLQKDWDVIPALLHLMTAGIPINVESLDGQMSTLSKHVNQCQELITHLSGLSVDFRTPRKLATSLAPLGCIPADERTQRIALVDDLWGTEGEERRELVAQIQQLSKEHPLKRRRLHKQFKETANPVHRQVLAALISRSIAAQRLSKFLRPIKKKHLTGDRIYMTKFDSLTSTTRFSSTPNMQALPKRAEKYLDEDWWKVLPPELNYAAKTRAIIAARPGYSLVSCDLSAAEPRYCAVRCEWSLQQKGGWLDGLVRSAWSEKRGRYPGLFRWAKERRIRKPVGLPATDYPDIPHDQLWQAFWKGDDPYQTMADSINIPDRNVVKQLWLSILYGKSVQNVAKDLNFSYGQAESLLKNLFEAFPMMKIIQNETRRQMLATGCVQNLWGRPRRIPGLYQLAKGDACEVVFRYRKIRYRARIIPLGMLRWGVHAFMERCWRVSDNYLTIEANAQKKSFTADANDPYVQAKHFVAVPFRNISYSCIQTVIEDNGFIHALPRFAAAFRSAFNAIFQGTGADHLRWLMVQLHCLIQASFQDVKMILSVHDELVFECPDQRAPAFVKAAKQIMTTPPPCLTVPVLSEFKVGKDYASMTNPSIDW